MKAKKIIVSVIAICIAATTGCSASPLANFKPVQTVPQSDLVAPENSIGISFPTETEKPTNTSTPADTSKTPESTDKPSVNESSLTHAEAKKIVDNTIENMKRKQDRIQHIFLYRNIKRNNKRILGSDDKSH